MEFIDNADKLETFTLEHATRFPKRFRFNLQERIVNYAMDIHSNVVKANDYPVTIEQYEKRLRLFYETREMLQDMVRKIEKVNVITKGQTIKPNVMKEWMWLIDRELRLLGGIISSDKDALKVLKGMSQDERDKLYGII